MKKFVKFFSVITVVLAVNFFMDTIVWAGWMSADCTLKAPNCTEEQLWREFENARNVGKPAAYYCFFNPDELGKHMFHRWEYAAPVVDRELSDIPVAICLKNSEAMSIFREYFKNKKDQQIIKLIDPRENVFIISFGDLEEMQKNGWALYTQNGILCPVTRVEAKYDDVVLHVGVQEGTIDAICYKNGMLCNANGSLADYYKVYATSMPIHPVRREWGWSERAVLGESRLATGLRGHDYRYRRKARILMDGLLSGEIGQTVRIFKSYGEKSEKPGPDVILLDGGGESALQVMPAKRGVNFFADEQGREESVGKVVDSSGKMGRKNLGSEGKKPFFLKDLFFG